MTRIEQIDADFKFFFFVPGALAVTEDDAD
jgi:hypothetical protein